MPSLDVFRTTNGQALIVMTGVATPPNVTNLATGDAIVLHPSRIESTGFTWSIVQAYDTKRANAWQGTLSTDPAETDVALSVVADGHVFRGRVSWPARQPEATPLAAAVAAPTGDLAARQARRRRRKAQPPK